MHYAVHNVIIPIFGVVINEVILGSHNLHIA